ncbi:MAG: ABC transporter permease [Bdellovibrionales bacterium]
MIRTIASLKWEFLKYFQSIKIFLIQNLIYKINFLLLMVVPIVVFFFIKYNLWVSIYEWNSLEIIKGYTLSKMIQYQLGIFLLDLFVRSYFFSHNLSADIRLGKISAFLLYPFNFLSYQFSKFLSEKILQLLIGCISFGIAIFFNFIQEISLMIFLKFFAFVLMINLFWFFTQTLIGLLSFWIEETWSLNVCIRFITAFMSGAFIPLELYPEWLQNLLFFTPFPYLIYFPVKILTGSPISFFLCFSIISFWIFVLVITTRLTWKQGLKMYTGAGI